MITRQQLEQIAGEIRSSTVSETLVERLRVNHSDVHFTYCMDDDVVAATPVYEAKEFNLYLIDSRNHCLCFTQDMDVATGVVLAAIEEE